MLGSEFTPVNTIPQDFSLSKTNTLSLYLHFFISSLPVFFSAFFFSPWSFSQVSKQWWEHSTELQELVHQFNSLKTSEHFVVQEYILWPETIENITTIEALGQVVYTYYAFFFHCCQLYSFNCNGWGNPINPTKRNPFKKTRSI